MEEKQGGYIPGQWDTEEDHLLSYFLGDQHALQSQRSFGGVAEPQSLTSVTRTPAVHFYGSSSSKGSKVPRAAPLGSASSSSSSLSSMAATLVSGGPVLHQYHQHPNHRPANTSPPSISPISPAATMGTPQEMLMLPPPPRNPTDQSEVERRRQHVAWLNQVNAMALMNQQQQQVPAYALAPTQCILRLRRSSSLKNLKNVGPSDWREIENQLVSRDDERRKIWLDCQRRSTGYKGKLK
ncbi:hypothetical protein MHU86_12716 [Fragilaria crotonensis]|nr:hypothetical protein MHU86_12716 [Fragilaria crotonensis]